MEMTYQVYNKMPERLHIIKAGLFYNKINEEDEYKSVVFTYKSKLVTRGVVDVNDNDLIIAHVVSYP
jgi:hypothetical protein